MSTELANLNELFCKNQVAVNEKVQKEVDKKEEKE